jgi:hypothetical protein
MFAGRTIICAIVCALLASALAGVAPATADERTQEAAALAQERYYSSYGEPAPLTVAQSPEPSDDTPWLPIALSVAIALATVAVSATLARRLHIRRRAARVIT